MPRRTPSGRAVEPCRRTFFPLVAAPSPRLPAEPFRGGFMLRRLLQWYERRQPKAMVVILAPEVTDPKPAVVTLNLQPGARILEAGSQAALGQLQRVGARYDLAYRQ